MSKSRLHVFGWGLVAAIFFVLLSASLGAGEARAGNCVAANFTFTLGSANPNTCNTTTSLISTGAGIGLQVLDDTSSATAIRGGATAATGAGTGVLGFANSSSTAASGIEGELLTNTPGPSSAGVIGFTSTATGNGPGVWGEHVFDGGAAPGVLGHTFSTDANASGVSGTINSHAANAAGVRGDNFNPTCCGMGVAGFHAGQGIGVYGEAPNGFGVSGFSPNNWSGYFQGSVNVVGTLFKSSGAFRIDNPLDPAHSYLQHSFVESPDMKNIYDGNVTTNSKGFATVKLPKYFQALNKDFRYQLTVLNGTFAQAIVSKQIHDNRFTIRTNKPSIEVSWQVTGIRKDAWANAHRIQTVVPKTGAADNKYVHPELYGKPLTKSVVVLPGMRPGTQPKFRAPTLPKQK